MVIDGILDNLKYGTAELEDTFDIAASAEEYGINSVGIVTGDLVHDVSNGIAINDTTTVGTVEAKNYGRGISPLTIDVGTCQSLTEGLHWNSTGNATHASGTALDVAGVVIGLPTVEITTYHSDDTKIISVVSGTPALTANSGETVPHVSNELIRIQKSGVSQMAILGGRLEIAPH